MPTGPAVSAGLSYQFVLVNTLAPSAIMACRGPERYTDQ